MRNGPVSTLGSIFVLAICLTCWRLLYPMTDWAAIALAPLALALVIGVANPRSAVYRLELTVALRPDSSLAPWLTGRLSAIFLGLATAALFLPVLAFQALSATPVEIACFAVLCMTAAALARHLRRRIATHLTPPFAHVSGNALATAASAGTFLLLLIWINWFWIDRPGAIMTQTLSEAVSVAQTALPARGGWIAELLTGFFALDAAKLWAVTHIEETPWPSLIYCVDAALTCFIIARSSVAVADFLAGLDPAGREHPDPARDADMQGSPTE